MDFFAKEGKRHGEHGPADSGFRDGSARLCVRFLRQRGKSALLEEKACRFCLISEILRAFFRRRAVVLRFLYAHIPEIKEGFYVCRP